MDFRNLICKGRWDVVIRIFRFSYLFVTEFNLADFENETFVLEAF